MSKPVAFVVPAEVRFEVTDQGVEIHHQGDVVLHTDFGGRLRQVTSVGGDVEVHGNVRASSVDAGGAIRILGTLEADGIRSGGALEVAGSLAGQRVEAGGALVARGDVRARTLKVAGDAQVEGALHAGSVAIGGRLGVAGDAEAEEARVGGALDVAGNLASPTLEVAGHARVGGGLRAQEVHAGGGLQVGGAVSATRIRAGGDVRLGETAADSLSSTGTVVIDGGFTGGVVRAAAIELGAGVIKARGFQAAQRVTVGAAKLQVDAILAPEVGIDPKASGRVTIIECQNELGPNAIKGGLSVADYEEMIGGADRFLGERGLGGAVETAPSAPPPPAPVAETAPPVRVSTPEAPTVSPDAPAPEPKPGPAPVEVSPPVAPAAAAEVEIEEDEPSEPIAPPPEHPLHGPLHDAIEKIADAYRDAAEVPPAVGTLTDLARRRAYDRIRADISTIWADLVKFHQKRNLRIQHQVTTTFNTINSLVKKM